MHRHEYTDQRCVRGRHLVCPGYHCNRVRVTPNVTDVERLYDERRKELHNLGIAWNAPEQWRLEEEFRDAYWAAREIENGKGRTEWGPKVWTCMCACHGRRRRYLRWTVWSWRKGHAKAWVKQRLLEAVN